MRLPFLRNVIAPSPIRVRIERRQIEGDKVSGHAGYLRSLTATRELVLENNARLPLEVAGYEGDERALWEIGEVRRFFRRLDDCEPQWFHLCNRTDQTLKMLFMCTSRQMSAIPAGQDRPVHKFDRQGLHSFMMRHYTAMKGLHSDFSVPQDTSEQISGLIIGYFRTMTNAPGT